MTPPTEDVRKMINAALQAPSQEIARAVLLQAGADPATLEKTISTSTGLVAYDLHCRAYRAGWARPPTGARSTA
jgi:hypothetical protein